MNYNNSKFAGPYFRKDASWCIRKRSRNYLFPLVTS